MFVNRHRSSVAITTTPRNAIPHVHHKEIDGVLKDLKVCSRRLKSALDSFTDELRTLERLYYKCKNQHRMALFFKRASEMRRYGRRLCELDVLERVDILRASFVGLDHTSDHKALRGAWSHVPNKPYIHFLTERLFACSALVCKMRERLENAYQHFMLAVQTGAFVQFIVVFIAMSSRMSTLTSELGEVLQLGISTCNRLLAIIHPTGTHMTTHQQITSESEPLLPSCIDHDVSSEDTGQAICEPVNVPTSAVERVTLDMRVTTPPSAGDHVSKPTSKAKAVQKSRVKKAKKKFDEIDEIFGC